MYLYRPILFGCRIEEFGESLMLCCRRRLKNWGISHWKHWLWKTLPDFYWMLISLKNILFNVMKGHTVSARYYILTRLKRMIINFWSVINPFINSNTGWVFYNVSFWIRVIFHWVFFNSKDESNFIHFIFHQYQLKKCRRKYIGGINWDTKTKNERFEINLILVFKIFTNSL